MNRYVYQIEEFDKTNDGSFVVGTFSTLKRAKKCFDKSLVNHDEKATTYWQVYRFDLNISHYERPNRRLLFTTFNIKG